MQGVLLHGGDAEGAVGRNRQIEMRALPFQRVGRARDIGKPQAHAIVMRHGEAIALGQEGEAAHARRRFKRLHRALGIARAHLFAGRPGDGAVFAQRERVDPFAFFVADLDAGSVGPRLHHAAVVAAGENARPVDLREQDRRAGMGRDAHPAVHEKHVAVGQRKRGRAAGKARRDDFSARMKGSDGGGQRGIILAAQGFLLRHLTPSAPPRRP